MARVRWNALPHPGSGSSSFMMGQQRHGGKPRGGNGGNSERVSTVKKKILEEGNAMRSVLRMLAW